IPQGSKIIVTQPSDLPDKELPVFDTGWLVNKYSHKKDFLYELLILFKDELPKKINALNTAIIDNDINLLIKTAHSLKGSTATLGALGLNDCARHLVESGRENDQEKIKIYLGKAETEVGRVLEVLSQGGPLLD
ncbi:MAG: Hpt domain-containing protein, partial [Deltaproteobacteria bacterium]|nr:Hpt domain-containing protein [Deltaproteobacteria bacterium]